jgi:hypothetical protein
MMRMKNGLALAAALCAVAFAAGCGSSSKSGSVGGSSSTAKAKVAVSTSNLQSDIKSIQLQIFDVPPPGTPGTGFPITTFLTLAPAGNVWTANVTGIPAAAAPGSQRTFIATAYDGVNATGLIKYQGTATGMVIAGQTAQITIILQEQNPPAGPSDYAPVISGLTASASYVLPGTSGTFSVSAYDPDDAAHLNRLQFNGEPLAYLWSATCTAGTLTIATPTAATTAFVAPASPVTSSICTVAIRVSETGLADNSSVTTYFTVTVNGNYGNADIFGFPNTAPVVTVRGDFRYFPFVDVAPGGVPQQQADLFFQATDADGDNVRFDLSAQCSDNGFDGTGALMAPLAAAPAAANFSAATFTTTNGNQVAPPASKSYTFNPTFGYPSPVTAYADAAASCRFQLQVHDLCTMGNCGPVGSQGALADGSDKGGSTTGFLNATAPVAAKRAPTIVRVNPANQSGPVVAGAMTWDPQKKVVVQNNGVYNIALDAEDTFANGPLSVSASCNVGTAAPLSLSGAPGTKTLHYAGTWTAPPAVSANMFCTYTVTSADTGIATATTVYYASTDPCITNSITDGQSCLAVTNDKCALAATCVNSVCTTQTAKTCTAADQCHVVGICDSNTGTCSNPNAAANTLCDADGSGCTQNDVCVSGLCTAGAAAACNTPPNAFCYPATPGACSNGGALGAGGFANNNFSCAYAPSTGSSCTVANAAAKCNGVNGFASFACDNTGACVGSGSQACTNTTCASGNTCQAATGACGGGAPAPVTTVCDDGFACTGSGALAPAADHCNGAGLCVAGTGLPCAAGQGCSEPVSPQTGPQCGDTVITPQVAKLLALSNSGGTGMDTAGNTYVTGLLVTPTKNFEGTNLTSNGAGDVFLGSYDSTGAKRWVVSYGDAADQEPNSLAVSSNGVLAFGRFGGVIANGPVNLNAGANTWDYVIFANPASGALTAGQAIDTGTAGVLLGAGGNLVSGEYAVCGKASQLALIGGTATTWATVAGANTYGGSNDIVIGVYNADGTLRWAKQIGTASDEDCDAVTFDSVGNVVAAGVYSGTAPNLTLAGATPLPNPGSSFRRWMWVATFNGTTGAGISQAGFGGGAGQHKPNAITVDATGNIIVAGKFTNTIPFQAGVNTACTAGTTGCLASDGGVDGFVMKFSSALAPIWATRVGVSTADDSINGVAVDSFDNVAVTGSLNGSATASTVTPTTVATAAVTDPVLTSAGGSLSSFIMKLPASTGLFNNKTTQTTGDATHGSGSKMISINRLGTGAVKDLVSFGGDFTGGTLSFGGSSTAISSPSGAASFVVFAKEQ